jgi:hypothetical protein
MLSGAGEFAVSRTNNVPEFSFATFALKVSSPAKFSDYRPISLLVCLSKVFELLMAR